MRVLLAVLIAAISVSCSAAHQRIEQAADGPFRGLPAPNSIEARAVSAVVNHLNGGDYTTGGNVSIDDPTAVYGPVGVGAGEVAYGLYTFSLPGFEQGRYLEQTWTTPPPSGSLWLGLSDRIRNRWEWLQPGLSEPLLIGDLAPYLNAQDELLVVVLLTGSGLYELGSIDVTGRPPKVTAVAPLVIAPGTPAVMTATLAGTGTLTYAWDFGGAVSPNTSVEAAPAVTAGAEGTYNASLRVSNILGTDQYDFELKIGAAIPELAEGQLVAIALDAAVTTAETARVVVRCGDFPEEALFTYMNGVAVTCDSGATYAPLTFNLGAVGGLFDEVDGIWAGMTSPTLEFFLPREIDLGSVPVTDDPGRIYIGFNITPVQGNDLQGGGDLFNFELAFDAPGTYTLGFLEFQAVKRTYYSDASGTAESDWLDITNDGAWNTITVTDP